MLDPDKMRRFFKNKYVLMFILIIVLAGISFTLYQYYHQDFGIREITPTAEDEFSVKYYMYVDEEAEVEEKTLMLHPFHAGLDNENTASDEANDHADEAYQAARSIHRLAEEVNAALIVPAFGFESDGGGIPENQDMVGRYEQSFAELEGILDHAADNLEDRGIEVNEDIYLFGFGYSSLFASRWLVSNPRNIERAALGAPGRWPAVPETEYAGQELEFPLGMSGLRDGEDNIEYMTDLPVFIFRGEEDEVSFLSERRLYSELQEETLQGLAENGYEDIFNLVVELYEDSPVQLRYEEYPEVDHRFNLEMHDDVVEFFRDN